jgi:hypothetical protein
MEDLGIAAADERTATMQTIRGAAASSLEAS